MPRAWQISRGVPRRRRRRHRHHRDVVRDRIGAQILLDPVKAFRRPSRSLTHQALQPIELVTHAGVAALDQAVRVQQEEASGRNLHPVLPVLHLLEDAQRGRAGAAQLLDLAVGVAQKRRRVAGSHIAGRPALWVVVKVEEGRHVRNSAIPSSGARAARGPRPGRARPGRTRARAGRILPMMEAALSPRPATSPMVRPTVPSSSSTMSYQSPPTAMPGPAGR